MAKKHTSLKDIATELHLSISTVSRALKDHPDISEKVKFRVKVLAAEWDYRPNPLAMGLLKSNTRMIGIIVPNIATHFYSSIISSIEQVATQNGYYCILNSSYESCEKEKECVENMLNARVEGLIVCISEETQDFSHFDILKKNDIPLVFFDRVCRIQDFPSVIADNSNSAYAITEYLIKNGIKRIAYMGGPNHLSITNERKSGYLAALKDYKIPIDRHLITYCRLNFEEGREKTKLLLKMQTIPEAIIGMNDTLAYAAMNVIKESKLRIPQDISLVGYTDEFHSHFVTPRLTTISHPTYEMGTQTAHLLINQLNGDERIQQITCKCKMIIQESTPIPLEPV